MTEPSSDFGSYADALLQSARRASAGIAGTEQGVEAMRARSEQIRAKLAELHEQTFNGLPDEDNEEDGADVLGKRREREPNVVAEVDGRGRLLKVDISALAMRDLDPDELSEAIVEAIALARKQAAERMREVFAELTPNGGDLPTPPPFSLADIDTMMAQTKEVADRWTAEQLKR